MWLNLAMSYSLDYLAGLAQGHLCRKETGREYRRFTGLQAVALRCCQLKPFSWLQCWGLGLPLLSCKPATPLLDAVGVYPLLTCRDPVRNAGHWQGVP